MDSVKRVKRKQHVYLDICMKGPSNGQAGICRNSLTELVFVKSVDELEAGDILVTERPLQFPDTIARIVDCEHMVERMCQKKGITYQRPQSPSPARSPSPSPLPFVPDKRPKPYKMKCTTQCMHKEFLLERERVAAIMDKLKNTEKLAEKIEQELASRPDLDVTIRELLEDSVVHMLGHRFGATWVERRQSEMAAAAAPTTQS